MIRTLLVALLCALPLAPEAQTVPLPPAPTVEPPAPGEHMPVIWSDPLYYERHTQPALPEAPVVGDLVSKFGADPESLSTPERTSIFRIAVEMPNVVADTGGDPEEIQNYYLDELVREHIDRLSASQLYALFDRSHRRSDRARAEEYFGKALCKAASDSVRADFYYSRAASGAGDRDSLYAIALQYVPSHGPTGFAMAREVARGIGRPSTLEERAAYWCLADHFREVAASGDPRVAELARRTAERYERAGPSRDEYFFRDPIPGATIRASSGTISCTTRVR